MKWAVLHCVLVLSSLYAEAIDINQQEFVKASLWEVKHDWDESWEIKYSNWIEGNLTADFFKRYNMKVDCGDVVYAMRWIFAREHGLPA